MTAYVTKKDVEDLKEHIKRACKHRKYLKKVCECKECVLARPKKAGHRVVRIQWDQEDTVL